MKYRVVFQPRASEQLVQQYLHLATRNPRVAAKWYNRLLSAIKGLSHSPQRCGLARESEITGREIRQLLFGRRSGKRRVLFVIKQDEVHILGIRHSAQSDAPPEELLD